MSNDTPTKDIAPDMSWTLSVHVRPPENKLLMCADCKSPAELVVGHMGEFLILDLEKGTAEVSDKKYLAWKRWPEDKDVGPRKWVPGDRVQAIWEGAAGTFVEYGPHVDYCQVIWDDMGGKLEVALRDIRPLTEEPCTKKQTPVFLIADQMKELAEQMDLALRTIKNLQGRVRSLELPDQTEYNMVLQHMRKKGVRIDEDQLKALQEFLDGNPDVGLDFK